MEKRDFIDILSDRIERDEHLTPASLAVKAGLDNSTIRQMLKKRSNPRIDTAVKICRALGETVETFLAEGRDPVTAEILFHLEQLTAEERRILLAAVRGLRDQDHGEAR